MGLVQALPDGPLDIIGDIHGEHEALKSVMTHLGYDADGTHPEARKLVFVGDFCDRGPDSPAVLALVERLVRAGRARAILGNHELNLLRGDAKDGSGWYFDSRSERDHPKFAPFARCNEDERSRIHAFLNSLPIVLERADLRVVHAAWIPECVEAIRDQAIGSVLEFHKGRELALKGVVEREALAQRMHDERGAWPAGLTNPDITPPFMAAHAEYGVLKQMTNSLKVLTSGVEQIAEDAFYSSGSWRFAERAKWWDDYNDRTPVVIGHYWRRAQPVDRTVLGKGDPDLFDGIDPFAWHGRLKNVFCVDFSVGGRWSERKADVSLGTGCKLAALRWPDCVLQFDDGRVVELERNASS